MKARWTDVVALVALSSIRVGDTFRFPWNPRGGGTVLEHDGNLVTVAIDDLPKAQRVDKFPARLKVVPRRREQRSAA